MSLAKQAFSALSNLEIPLDDSAQMFQKAGAQVTVAATVASVATAKAGKLYMDCLGPKMIEAIQMRAALDNMDREGGEFQNEHGKTIFFILGNAMEVSKMMFKAVAAVRTDIGIAKKSDEDEFLAAVNPDEELFRSVMEKAFGRKFGE